MKSDRLDADVLNLLGLNPNSTGFTSVQSIRVEDHLGWDLEHLVFTNAEAEKIPGYFLRPPDRRRQVPAVVYAHAHGNRYGLGGAELLTGTPSLQGPFAPDLRRLGIAALSIDLPAFGARQAPGESHRAKTKLWRGETLFGQMLEELRFGVDFLLAHPVIDASRIGAIGFSMGSTLAWWLAALEPRICAASALCSFADLGTLVTDGAHDGHGIYMTVPGLLSRARSGQIAGLAAPKPLQICVGLQDWSTPKAAFDQGRADLEIAYAKAQASDRLSFHIEPNSGHHETPAMRAAVLGFLNKALGSHPTEPPSP